MSKPFRVTLTADFQQNGELIYQDVGLDILESADGVDYAFMPNHTPEVTSGQLADTDAVIALSPRFTASSLEDIEDLTVISRFGVGYDSVDVDACTESDVLLTITRGGVNHSVAEATIAFMLAISHNLLIKDRLTREGRWDDRGQHMGSELRDRTLGIVGFGGIGSTLAEMIGGFGMGSVLVHDPYVTSQSAEASGVELVSLDELMKRSDFVSINCPLNDETRDLIGSSELGLMKPTAYLINTARGGIVNESALIDVLSNRTIAGAALDCHETEPFPAGHPMADLDNVILAPHAIAWTNELFRDLGRMCCRQVLDISQGVVPEGVVNADVLERPVFRSKLDKLRELSTARS